MASVTAALTSDADEAESWLRERQPTSLVLDQGLPRMTVFRLYGLVRTEEEMHGIAVLFVGQEGQGGVADHYLPADASPLAVAAQAQQLAARRPALPAPEAEAGSARAADLDSPSTASTDPGSDWGPAEKPVVETSAVPVAPARRVDEPVEEPEGERPAPLARPGKRLDLMLFWGGVALLVLGLAAVYLNPFPSTQVISPPTVVPSLPTVAPSPPARPAASPSPAALGAPSPTLDRDPVGQRVAAPTMSRRGAKSTAV
jgi:hypothetical protein